MAVQLGTRWPRQTHGALGMNDRPEPIDGSDDEITEVLLRSKETMKFAYYGKLDQTPAR